MKELIIGGARSGKSALAEQFAQESGLEVVYLATATAEDKEMAERIRLHQERRAENWSLVEEPFHLAEALRANADDDRVLLIDCLTLWTTNLLLNEDPGLFQKERDALLACLPELPGRQIFVSNEVGMGIVPLGELNRRFQDEAGWLNQAMAVRCDRVILTVAGLPHYLKGAST
ncbi:bifunctional adenosylcobinamide kinase/adenosylcobinamide-phosphate guanylyltransferase [Solemya velesiana gill symbiont]|uniref:Bifunctional adenosylcobalamin biosynthesis protein n=1 Tax=Solemya velesiana gill symbiont TaxID=1918948 RepID=A0A1T2KT88_9GAMM|nr:bifunctional adenosylcobinamide kinase/adenosylcobinamide-phosphate guanylyltransferase [Solemya velesiana gill symbiont]OOZ36063.1 bifunctional adenosylcobinamide kinase/adenosylcobinamide-phosphate guanylyltransferase [Solemya velesiana gill symbiont]